MIAIDTNVLVYTADTRSPEKRRQAISLLSQKRHCCCGTMLASP